MRRPPRSPLDRSSAAADVYKRQAHAAATEEGMKVSVKDEGLGIAAADLPHLFDRFYRGEAARARAGGTGMGLWIARGLLAGSYTHLTLPTSDLV